MARQTAAGGAARSTAQLGVGALVLAFVFASWCVLVGGLSAVQHRGTRAVYVFGGLRSVNGCFC